MIKWTNVVALVATMLVMACKDSPTDNGDDPGPDPGPPVQLSVLANGGVTERYTSEVAAFGDWVYTGTWSVRTTTINGQSVQATGNALRSGMQRVHRLRWLIR